MLQLRVFTDAEIASDVLAEIRRCVFDAYAGDFSDEDWEHTFGGWRVVAFDADVPIAHAAVVPRLLQVAQRTFRTGYVEAVATSLARRRAGLGGLVMHQTTELVRKHFELGALSTASHGFYTRMDWQRWRGPSFVQDGAQLVRTPDEDDGLMVLRFGPSAAIDLTARIVCQRRSGDDW